MTRYVFDIETDGLLKQLTKVHSLVLRDVDTGEVTSCADHDGFTPVCAGLEAMMLADNIIGHNVIKFDIPAIQKVYPWFEVRKDQVIDTLVYGRLVWPNISDTDTKLIHTSRLPGKLRGSHSLKAYGYRLGVLKGEFSNEDTDWSTWTPEMQTYCEQDTEVTLALINKLESKNYSHMAVELEHRVAWILAEQERNGFMFNTDKAEKLLSTLQQKRAAIEDELQDIFPPIVTERYSEKTGKRLKDGVEVFNPGSRIQVVKRLADRYGWEPEHYTEKGQPKIDETILSKLPYPEAQKIAEYFMLQKRIGQIAEGKYGWLNLVEEDERLHGSVNTNGAVTGRMTHMYPNVAQVPSVGKPYGAECRELFCVPKGKKLVGIDVSGLELRMLAHFMKDAEYTRELLEGDIHTANQKAAGLDERSQAKTFIYAFLYGAGDAKIGSIVGKGSKAGKELKNRFLARTPALGGLLSRVSTAAKRGYLMGLDGRKLHVRHQHAALNTLLQSAGALVCKRWIVELEDALIEENYADHVKLVATVHDEVQLEVDEWFAERVGKLAVECIDRAGTYFNVRVPLTGEYKIGNNWAECH